MKNKPKKDGSGKGVRANKNRSNCNKPKKQGQGKKAQIKLISITLVSLIILTFFLFNFVDFGAKEIGDLKGKELPKEIEYNITSVKIESGFGGKIITQLEVDKDYPCYLQSDGSSICPKIKPDKLISLNKEYDTSKGIPKTDLRKPEYKIVGKEIIKVEEKDIEIDISEFSGYETTYLNPNIEQKFTLNTNINGLVKIGWNSNIFSVSDYNFGSGDNVTMRSYGVSIENSHADWNESMVLWLQMTDDATDSSGNGNDGTVTGATHNFSWYEFDGTNDRIPLTQDYNFNFSQGFTFSAWSKTDNDEFLTLLNFRGDYRPQVSLQADRNRTRLVMNMNTTCYKTFIGSSISNEGGWQLNTVVWNGSSGFVYTNGVLKTSVDAGSCKNWGNYTYDGDRISVGATIIPDSLFNGSIDEVIIYNTSLTSTEITALYNKGLFKHLPSFGNYTSGILDAGQNVNWTNINWTFSNETENQNVTLKVRTGEIAKPDFSDASLVSMWSLNQSDTNSSKTSAVDIVGNNDGIAYGGMTVGEANGVFQGENASGFDGVDDRINCGTDVGFNFTQNFTLSAWINLAQAQAQYGGSVICKRDSGTNSQYCLRVKNDDISFYAGASDSVYASNLNFNQWYHILVNVNDTHNDLYLDGILKKSSSFIVTTYNSESLGIGSEAGSSTANFFNGSIAYVSIFNKSLTQDEIINWSTYTGELLISQGETLDLPVNRYLQYKAKLQTNDTKYTPILTEVNLEYDGTPPNVIINTPLNDSYTTNSITFNVTATDDTSMSSCEYSLDNGITNISMTNLTDDYTHTNSSMNQGSHTVIFYCKDRENNLNDTESVTFFVDSIVPLIEITYPANISYTSNVSSLNYTHTETNCDKVWWSNSSGVWNSSTQSCGTNWTDLTSNEGSNTWTVYINDTSGNENSSSVTFFKDTTNPSIVLTSPPDNSQDTDGIVRFLFTPTDTNQINNCSLIYQNGIYTTSTSISNGVSNVIEVVQINELHALYLDDLQWSINCTDEYSNTGSSETRNLDTKEISQGGGGGGSSGTTLQNPKSIDLFYPEVWYRDSEVELVIKVYNQLGGLYSPEILLNFSIDGVQVTDSKTNFFDHIINEFKISKTATLGEHKINIQVKDEKIIEQEITITIEEKKDKITSLIDTDEKMLKYLLYGGGGLIILTFLIIILTTISADKKRS